MKLLRALRHGVPALLLSAVAGWPAAAPAATVPNLYDVTVTPDPAAADQRAAVLQAAMGRLLVRITGNRNIEFDPAAAGLLAAPDDYLTSYGLDRQGRARVGFSRGQVERALTSLGLPVWGPERPLTLVWVAVDDGAGGRALLGATDAPELGAALSATTTAMMAAVRSEIEVAIDERGLPVAWPLLDLEDLNAVTFADVWGGFEAPLLAASARYRADAVLIGRVRPGLFGNEVDWLFVNGVERSALPLGAVRDGVDAAADRYAAELSTVGGASFAALTVRNVLTSVDYGRVMSYLERQSVLERVDVESFMGGTLNLRVAARGDARVLERVLALGGVLRPAAGGAPMQFEVVENGLQP